MIMQKFIIILYNFYYLYYFWGFNIYWDFPVANNESSEVIDILLPVTFYFNPSTRLDNIKNV